MEAALVRAGRTGAAGLCCRLGGGAPPGGGSRGGSRERFAAARVMRLLAAGGADVSVACLACSGLLLGSVTDGSVSVLGRPRVWRTSASTGPSSYLSLRMSSAMAGVQASRICLRRLGGRGCAPCLFLASSLVFSHRAQFFLVQPAVRQKAQAQGSWLDLRVGQCCANRYSAEEMRLGLIGLAPLGLRNPPRPLSRVWQSLTSSIVLEPTHAWLGALAID